MYVCMLTITEERKPHCYQTQIPHYLRPGETDSVCRDFIVCETESDIYFSRYTDMVHVPSVVEQVVCCRLTPLQTSLYRKLVNSSVARQLARSDKAPLSSLAAITILKKLCNRESL